MATETATATEQPQVSILVPVFNMERYLRTCLDSLVGQSLAALEIICIDDGSTDASPQIIAEYAARDKRIRVISKGNTGYGDSMNQGLVAARGRYVGICEPDDYVDRGMYEIMVRHADKHGCDIVKCNYSEHVDGRFPDRLASVLGPFPQRKPIDPRDYPQLLLTAPTIWAGIYRKGMIEEAGIAFSPTPGASFQDASFAHQCWIAARRVLLLSPGYYHYRIDNAAQSSRSGSKVFAICGEYERTFAFLEQRDEGDLALFGPWVNVMRHGVYLWNYNRIAPEYHRTFAERWERDLLAAYDDSLLDPAAMTPGYRALFAELLDGPDAFAARYPDVIPVPPIM